MNEHPVLTATVDELLAASGGEAPPPGAAFAVDVDGMRFGVAAGERQTAALTGQSLPMTLETAHDLASVTKIAGTTASLMRLVADGSVGLDDEVTRFWPEFHAGVTVRELLLHRAGLWEWWPLYLEGEPYEAIARLPLRYGDLDFARSAGGVGFHYSDLGFMTLGRIIEVVTGSRIDEAAERLVFEPLGMTSASYGGSRLRSTTGGVAASSNGDAIERRMVETGEPYPVTPTNTTFTGWREHVLIGEVNDGNAFHAFGGAAGHAGMFATIDDLLKLGSHLAQQQSEFYDVRPDPDQALGFRHYELTDGTELLGHPGFTGCALFFVPSRRTAAVVATNRLHVDGVPTPSDRIVGAALRGLDAVLREDAHV